MRVDRERNRNAIIAAAHAVFRADGPSASLEAIARRADVGSATLHRHFQGRASLLQAVFEAEVGRLAAAAEQEHGPDGLWQWLGHVVRHCAADKALGAAVSGQAGRAGSGRSAWEPLRAAAMPLAQRARDAGELREDVSVDDLLELIDAVSRTAAGRPDHAAHLLDVVRRGSTP